MKVTTKSPLSSELQKHHKDQKCLKMRLPQSCSWSDAKASIPAIEGGE